MSTPISRRTIVKGAAWSLPVIAAAVAMPLASASTPNESGACLRFIGTNLTRKGLKFKVQNQCSATARNVSVLALWSGGSLTVPLGDIPPHGHAPTEHERIYSIPAEVTSVILQAVTLDGSASAETTVTR